MVDAHRSPLQGLRAYVLGFGDLCERDAPARACMLSKTVLETPDDDPVLRARAEAHMAAMERAFTTRFQAAIDAEELPPTADPARLARRMQAAIIGLRAYAQRGASSEAVRALAEDLAPDPPASHGS